MRRRLLGGDGTGAFKLEAPNGGLYESLDSINLRFQKMSQQRGCDTGFEC